ncbi:MAG TPA: TadE/TadG family type IV pilus assembly protein [Candidatus Dormibacteraeota bacterium]|nr:TadE/TadG family type IV pilus assembly protein [Candidatus Dormibacteraeota bacterium]
MPEKAQPPTPRLRRGPPRKRGGGQALVEFAVTLPILVLLVAGVLELGRGYTFAVATSNAAREGARYVAGKTSTTNGPGLANMCSLVKADLAATTTNVICPTQVNHAPPFVAGTDYTAPVAGQAVVAVYCGASLNCTGSVTALSQSEVDVYVYYGFSDLNLLGGGITISGSSRATTSW